jgi:hypothetical protein
MTDGTTASATPLFSRTLQALTIAGLLVLALIVAGVWADRQRTSDLERVIERSSVGDFDFFAAPASTEDVAAVFQGEPLYVTSLEPVKFRDAKMRRAGEDEQSRRSIYQLRESATEYAEKWDSFYLKIGRERYLEAKRRELPQ